MLLSVIIVVDSGQSCSLKVTAFSSGHISIKLAIKCSWVERFLVTPWPILKLQNSENKLAQDQYFFEKYFLNSFIYDGAICIYIYIYLKCLFLLV